MQLTVGLTFPGKLKDEAVICSICKQFQLYLTIVEASFSMTAGWAILGIEGEKEEISRVFDYLTKREIKIQEIEKAK